MPETAASVWRDFEVDGLPASGIHRPAKSEVRAWGGYLESFITAIGAAGSAVYLTRVELFADLTAAAKSSAWVIQDSTVAYNGVYRKNGGVGTGSWTRVGDLPYSFIIATDAGAGTPDAIQATSTIPISASALVILSVSNTNTGSPVTVSFNGGSPLTIKTNSGNDIAVGGLLSGMSALGIVSGTTFRLVSDQASASILAEVEAAHADVIAATEVVTGAMTVAIDPQFTTKAQAQSFSPAVAPGFIRLSGYWAVGDGGGALYKKVTSEPAHAGKFSITLSGGGAPVWFEISERVLDPRMLGAKFDGATNDGAAIVNTLAIGKNVSLPAGTAIVGDAVFRPVTGQTIRGIRGSTILKKTTTGSVHYSKPFFDVVDVKDVTIEGLTLDFTKTVAQELAFHLRSTTPGTTQNIIIRENTVLKTWMWIERYVWNTKIVDNVIDGMGIGYAGVATGGRLINGAHDPSVNPGLYGGGPQRWLLIEGNFIARTLTEGIDCNWYDSDIIIRSNILLDCNADEVDIGQSAIDVGSNDTTDVEVSARVIIESNLIWFSTARDSGGIEVKRDLAYCRISGNIMGNPGQSGTKSTGIIITNVNDLIVDANIIIGFKNGITMVNDAGMVGGSITNNTIRSPGAAGIVLDVVNESQILNNRIFGSTTAQNGIIMSASVGSSNRNKIRGNEIRGSIISAGIFVSSVCADTDVESNDVTGMVGAGIAVDGIRSKVKGNRAANNGALGFLLSGDFSQLEGNHATNNGAPGFQISGGTDNIVISNNIATDTRSGGARTQTYGFYFAAACDSVAMVGNIAKNNSLANNSGTASLTNFVQAAQLVTNV